MISVEEKKRIIKELIEKVNSASGFYLADFFNINVETITGLRAALREKGAVMIVAKNTLFRRVFEACKIEGLEEYLVGPTSIILAGEDDPIAPAKVITDFRKQNKELLPVKAVRIEKLIYSGDKIKDLSKMPGKRELHAQIISIALGVGAKVIGLIKGPGSNIAGQINSLIENLEEK